MFQNRGKFYLKKFENFRSTMRKKGSDSPRVATPSENIVIGREIGLPQDYKIH